MKKLICILLVLSMALSMAGCKTERRSDAIPTADPADPGTAIEKRVIYNENKIKITLSGLSFSPEGCPSLALTVQNKSKQKITVEGRKIVVNGITFDGCINGGYLEVMPGKTAVGEFTPSIFGLELDELGFTGPDAVASFQTEHIILYGENYLEFDRCGFDVRTCVADTVTYEPRSQGRVMYEDENFVVKYQGPVSSLADHTAYLIFVENKSNTYMEIDLINMYVNDFPIDIYCYTDTYPGTVSYAALNLPNKALKNMGLDGDSVEKLSFSITFQNRDIGYCFTTQEINFLPGTP